MTVQYTRASAAQIGCTSTLLNAAGLLQLLEGVSLPLVEEEGEQEICHED